MTLENNAGVIAIQITSLNSADLLPSPQSGLEQAGIRPGLLVQNDVANAVAAYHVTIVCAVSTKLKGYKSNVKVNPTKENGLTVVSEVNTA